MDPAVPFGGDNIERVEECLNVKAVWIDAARSRAISLRQRRRRMDAKDMGAKNIGAKDMGAKKWCLRA